MPIPTFMSLNIGVSALQAMQQAESVVGNNIANASTSGYAQETTNFSEGAPYPQIPGPGPNVAGQFSQGVTVSNISRNINAFYNLQDRLNQGTYQMYSSRGTVLTQIQSILNEPSNSSLQNSLDQFFQSWQSLSTDPQSTAARQAVLSQIQTMGQTFQTVTTQLQSLQSNLQGVISGQVNQLNQDAAQVAQLNQQIVAVVQSNESPNTLLDQRGKLLNDMSQLANITYSADPSGNGAVTVNIVQSSGHTINLVTGSTAAPYSTSNAQISQITSGQIAGNVQGYNDVVQTLGSIEALLTSLAGAVNSQHQQGFTPTGAPGGTLISGPAPTGVISLASGVTTGDIAAAGSSTSSSGTTSAGPGDNQNAIAMAQLQGTTETSQINYTLFDNTTVSQTSTGTFDQLLGQIVTTVGTNTSAVQFNEQTANALAQQSSQLRQSVSGVSTDQQAALMVQYQNSYNAAAKFISVFDQMLQNLISSV